MKACMCLATYLDGEDFNGNNRFDRNVKFLNYYLPLKKLLGYEDFWIVDNGSSPNLLAKLMDMFPELKVKRFDEHLQRKSIHDYPYCWRALYEWRGLIAQGYDKIISIDSDAYILTSKLATWIRDQKSGWNTLWCMAHNFPEAAICVLNKDKFDLFMGFSTIPWQRYTGLVLEHTLPFSHIYYEYKTARYDVQNDDIEEIENADAIIQTPNHIEMDPVSLMVRAGMM